MNNFDANSIKIDKKCYKDVVIFRIGYVTMKDSKK